MLNDLFRLIIRFVLFPLAFLWENIYLLRRFLYVIGILRSTKLNTPVVSIGNLTFGGTGKTPSVLWVSRFFEKKHLKVNILTRGYKGKLENESGILRANKKLGHNPDLFGDEALMMVNRLDFSSVLVGKNRIKTLLKYFDQEKPDVVILDDGHQHLKIRRNFNVLLFDATMPLQSYKVAPLGYLREGMSAVDVADFIIITRADLVPGAKIQELRRMIKHHATEDMPISLAKYEPKGLFNVFNEFHKELISLRGKKVILLAGIASPSSFLKLLESTGIEVTEQAIFPDHHNYSSGEIDSLLAKVQGEVQMIVTTEKDMVKIRRITTSDKIYYLQVDLEFISGQKEFEQELNKLVI